ncbi:MAG: hypothetical protein RSA79_03675 [Oscillospiraceae bacterium]
MFCIIKKAKNKIFTKQITAKIIKSNNYELCLISIKNPEKIAGKRKFIYLKNIISRANNNVIFTPDIVKIEHIMESNPQKYSDVLFQNNLKNTLKKEKNETVLFLDIFAKHQCYCDFLSDFFKHIKVVTQDEKKYEKKRESLLNKKGIAISVVEKMPANLENFSLIISPDNFIFSSMEKCDKTVLIKDDVAKNMKNNIKCFKNSDISKEFIPQEIEEFFVDKKFDFKFQSALFEFCGVVSQKK